MRLSQRETSMQSPLLNDRDLEFILYEFLDTKSLLQRPRYQEHNKEIFDASLNTAKVIADRYFANHNSKGDEQEPSFDGNQVHLIEETKAAWDAFAEAGFLSAHCDFDSGGMQLPETILRACMCYFSAANAATTGYPFLAIGAGNLLDSFAGAELKQQFLPHMRSGRFAGTMALTEPDQGSSLADIKTQARLASDGNYRLYGQKMFISGGDHNLCDNIVHMVLAKIEGAPPGAKGISLFACPKFLTDADGNPSGRNDVALAGLLHKMGYRNTTSTVLNFGERDGAIAYLIGEPHKGLQYMFQMMNEARIGVGLGAATLAYQGYNVSLDYARQRPQGRHPSNKDPQSKQINLIEHADVKRMLLAQKAYAEGSLAMCLFASSLFEDSKTANDPQARQQAFLLLDLITPVIKSWPSKYGLKANELAIQVLGGSGYIREYPLEQYYRDNRLNPIHEGAEGIHGIDLLGRKLILNQGQGFKLFNQLIHQTLAQAKALEACQVFAGALESALTKLNHTSQVLIGNMAAKTDLSLANASLYLDVFGRVFAAWVWLEQGNIAAKALVRDAETSDSDFYRGKLHCCRYYFDWELVQIYPQLELLERLDTTTTEMRNEWF